MKKNLQSTVYNLQSNIKGSAWAGLIILMFFIISIGLALTSDVTGTIVKSKRQNQTVSAQTIAEAGIDKAVWKLNQNSGYVGETNVSLPTGTLDIQIQNVDAQTKYIHTTGYVPSKTAVPKVTRKISTKVSATPDSQGVAFEYAIQSGTGGINLNSNAHVQGASGSLGNLYSNGNITLGNNVIVTGSITAHGTVTPNPFKGKTATTGAPLVDLPPLDVNTWKNYATAGGVTTGNFSPTNNSTVGPKKITGNFSAASNTNFNIGGPLYIVGNLTLDGNANATLSNTLGTYGTVIIVDGTVSIGGNAKVTSNAGGGYLLIASTSTSSSAINYGGNGESSALGLYAMNGTLNVTGNGHLVSMCGQTLNIGGNGIITYKSGMATANFAGGPGGSWKIKEWQTSN